MKNNKLEKIADKLQKLNHLIDWPELQGAINAMLMVNPRAKFNDGTTLTTGEVPFVVCAEYNNGLQIYGSDTQSHAEVKYKDGVLTVIRPGGEYLCYDFMTGRVIDTDMKISKVWGDYCPDVREDSELALEAKWKICNDMCPKDLRTRRIAWLNGGNKPRFDREARLAEDRIRLMKSAYRKASKGGTVAETLRILRTELADSTYEQALQIWKANHK